MSIACHYLPGCLNFEGDDIEVTLVLKVRVIGAAAVVTAAATAVDINDWLLSGLSIEKHQKVEKKVEK